MTSKPRRSSRRAPNASNANVESSLGKWYDDNQVVRRAWATQDAERIRGKSSGDIVTILGFGGRAEMIHRDDLVMGSA